MNNPTGMADNPIPQADLDAIRKREEAASIGPWEEYDLPFSASSGGVPFCQGCYCIEWDNQEGDRPFIVHARDDLPRLRIALEATYGRIAELEAELEVARELLRGYGRHMPHCNANSVRAGGTFYPHDCTCGWDKTKAALND